MILNDVNPCYQITEKLWRQFDSKEKVETHLECELEVFGKSIDDRYEYKGDITYKKLYEDNLSKDNQDLVMDNIKDEKVSLYKREFLGIDKECHMKYDITEEQNDELKSNQTMEKNCSLVEGIIILIILFLSILETIISIIRDGYRYRDEDRIKAYNFFFLINRFIITFCMYYLPFCFLRKNYLL